MRVLKYLATVFFQLLILRVIISIFTQTLHPFASLNAEMAFITIFGLVLLVFNLDKLFANS